MSTIEKMQRLLAILLLNLIGLLPFGSAIANIGGAARLPACCRASGKHHCAMKESGQKPGLRSIADQCPFVPAVTSAFVGTSVFPVPAHNLSVQSVTYQRLAQEQAGRLFRIAFDRNCQKRGPPDFLLS
jgi:hypothetical protein